MLGLPAPGAGAELSDADGIARLARALAHPVRVAIVLALDRRRVAVLAAANGAAPDPGAFGIAPVDVARALGLGTPEVGFHARYLAKQGVTVVVRTEARRGAIKHHYVLTPDGVVAAAMAARARGYDAPAD